ncbi:MAG: BBP7 family outer membrane beta-barrel protein [Gemmatales bacterium]|nr:BBP7 family outer membrane beta-barrel protein [Gemmatales bacterium]MDW8387844.1 BBP7 family outer membrane beta-barrel protein [Gemmatales bacterium]
MRRTVSAGFVVLTALAVGLAEESSPSPADVSSPVGVFAEVVLPSDAPPPGPQSPVALQWPWVYPYAASNNAPRNIWLDAEYVLWWSKEARLPPLVTGGPPGSTGILGQPDTTILAGATDLDHNHRSGGRFTAGLWLDYDQTLGIEGGYQFAGERTVHLPVGAAVRPAEPILARPFDDAQTGLPSSSRVLFPNLRIQFVDIASSTWFQGAEFSVLVNHWHGPAYRVDFVGGFRFLELQDELRILESSKIDRNAPELGGSRIYRSDEFAVRNRLVGAHAGLQVKVMTGPFFGSVLGRVSFGGMEQQLDIRGFTLVDSPTEAPEPYNGGFLALPSNEGVRDRWKFVAVPELTARLGCTFRHRYTLFVGYTILYWAEVLRAGDQIDLTLNPAQMPISPAVMDGPNRPEVLWRETSFWIQGLSLGCEIRF